MSYLKTKTTKKIILISLIIVFMGTSIEYGANNFTANAPPIPDEFTIENNLATASINSLHNYTMTTGYAYNWIDVSGGTELFLTDDGYSTQPLPFDFRFYNETFSTIYLGANGYLSFNDSSPDDWSNDPLPSGDLENYYLIAPFWDDLRPYSGGGSGNITVQSFGTYWVAEWRNIEYYWTGSVVGTFQVILYQTGQIIFNYDYLDYTTDPNWEDGYTCGLNLGADVQYYNSYQGLNNLTDDFSILFTYPIFYDIVIDDLPGSLNNWTWAETQPWFGGGSGTELDPYIIEDVTFMYSSGVGECIRIFNSRKHFVIRNCTIINSNPSLAGLHLNNVTNGEILNNQIVFNGYGIVYIDVNNTTISNNNISTYSEYGVWLIDDCDNNIITGNTINGNGGNYGVVLDTDTDNNLIYENYVSNHIILSAIDDGTNNNWNNTLIGNHWDNYIGYDMNLDGIGDDPYSIPGSAGNSDYLPIWNLQTPIAIDDLPTSLTNWSWVETQPWFGGGSGTEIDPFILEDFTIDAGGTGNCISIENSFKYFIIRECTLTNSGSTLTDAGVYLSNVTNAAIINNDCSNNYNGIYFEYSHDNDFSLNTIINHPYVGIWGQFNNENNTLSNNVITNSQWGIAIGNGANNIIQNNNINVASADGILLYGSGNNCIIDNNYVNTCNVGIRLLSFTNCIISRNTIINSTSYGLNLDTADNTLVFENYFLINGDNAIDNGANNDWNNTVIGNYWDDYTGYDMDLDGIGDDPYSINGSAGNFDYLPIWDLQGPIAIDDLPSSLNNWTWAASQAWCSGSGTELDPYIIENVSIDASSSPTGSGIFINNSKNDYFIIRNCNITNAGSGNYDAGIKLENTNHGTLINNNCSNNGGSGIFLLYSEENTISDNTANDNDVSGIYLNQYCDYNTISGNTANGNDNDGIRLATECDYNTISGNTADKNIWYGIELWMYCDNNTLSGNTANDNTQRGIHLDNCDNNTISDNTANYNTYFGIYLYQSHYTNITGNTANYNDDHGIYLENNCDNNTILGNTANDNNEDGIRLYDYCNDNTILGNTANGNTWNGICLYQHCDDNTISENTANGNNWNGISIYHECYYNTISGNTVNGNNAFSGIVLEDDCDNNTLSGNTASGNGDRGIYLYNDCDNNTLSGNTVNKNSRGIYLYQSHYNYIIDNIFYNNTQGIRIASGCDNNSIYKNFFLENGIHAIDYGTDNTWNSTSIGNYWDNHTGPDTSPNDGIVDTPYTYIGGSAGSIDYLPIAEDGPPSIIINSPSEDDIFGTSAPSFSVTITDDFLNETWYTLDGGLHNYTFTGSTGTLDQTAWDAMPDGLITLTFYASDIPGNLGFAKVNIEKDGQAPLIVISSPITDDTFGATVPSFIVEISDNNLDSMWYSLDGGTTNFVFIANGTINQTAWSALAEGSVTITFYANDTLGNLESESVDVVKSLPPPDDNFVVIIIIVISIVAGVAIVTVVVLLRRRKA